MCAASYKRGALQLLYPQYKIKLTIRNMKQTTSVPRKIIHSLCVPFNFIRPYLQSSTLHGLKYVGDWHLSYIERHNNKPLLFFAFNKYKIVFKQNIFHCILCPCLVYDWRIYTGHLREMVEETHHNDNEFTQHHHLGDSISVGDNL